MPGSTWVSLARAHSASRRNTPPPPRSRPLTRPAPAPIFAPTDRYRDSVTKALRKFSDSMQQSADQVMDTSAIQSDIDKMTESVSSLTNMSGGIDMGRLTSVYMENLQTMANIGRNSFRPQLLMGGMNSYMEFLNSLTTCNTDLMKAIAQACMPSSRV